MGRPWPYTIVTMSSPTPGCFHFFRRGRVNPPSMAAAPAAEAKAGQVDFTPPPLPAAHAHIEPCFQCDSQFTGFKSLKLDDDLPPYTARSFFSSDVSAEHSSD